MLDLTSPLPRVRPQVYNSSYPGGLRFFAESVDSDGNTKSASKRDFMYAYVSLCNDTLHFAGGRLTSASAQQFPTELHPEAMIKLAVASHAVLVLPRCIFATCEFRHPDMDIVTQERPSFRADISDCPVTISFEGAVTLDQLIGLVATKQAIQLLVPRALQAPAAPQSPADRLAAQAATASTARACILPSLIGVAAMHDAGV